MAATTDMLQELHSVFASYLLSLMQPVQDEEGKFHPPSLSAPQLAVIAKFLKDNDISATDDDDDDVRELKEALKNNALNRGYTQEDIDLALESHQFGATH